MLKTIGTLVGAILIGVFGFFGAQTVIGATYFSAQAGTVGSVFAMVVFFATMFATRNVSDGLEVRARVKSLARKKTRASEMAAIKDHRALETAARVAQRVFLLRADVRLPKTRARLAQAGYFTDRAMFIFILVQATLALSGPAVGLLVYAFGASALIAACSGLGATLIGWFAPEIILAVKAKSRLAQLFVEFPDALDLIVIYVESGNAFDTALVRVIETMQSRYPTVTGELKLLEYELRYFTNRSQAFENLAKRANIDIVTRLVSIVQQSEQIGSSISESLKILAKDSRDDRFLHAERKAAKLPVIMQIPIITLILPALFMLVLGPVAIKIFDIFSEVLK